MFSENPHLTERATLKIASILIKPNAIRYMNLQKCNT